MKKLFTFFLALAASVGSTFAFDFGTCGDNMRWTLADSVLTISGTGKMTNYSSTSAPWPIYRIKSVLINEGVTSIGKYAFSGCNRLTSVTIPNSVTSIGDGAFNDCYRLTSVTIPNSVTSIGNYTFEGCSGLISVTIPNSVISIGELAFHNCTGLTSMTIPNSVTSIGNYAFSYCSGLISVTIPNSVTSLGNYAFSGCSSLTSVTIPENVTSIGENAFKDCSNLASVTINSNTIVSKNHDIYNYTSSTIGSIFGSQVTEYIIGEGVMSIGSSAFYNCNGLASVTIGNSVTSIGNSAFSGCSSLASVTIGNSVTSIGEFAFSGCSSLTSVTIPENVTSIGKNAFKDCSNLASVHITDLAAWYNIQFGGALANPLHQAHNLYVNGELLSNLVIPSSVTSIGNYTFDGCNSLNSVTIPNSVTSIGNYAFSNCTALTSMTIGNSVTSIGENTFSNCSSLNSVTIPNSVTCIGHYAFKDCTALTSMTIGNSVTSIGGYAFYGCSGLTSVTIPNSVTSIGDLAFYNCSGLTSVTIGNSVTSIGENTFSNCSSLNSVTIPNSVTSIGYEAFRGCENLTSVTIGNSVTSIGGHAFRGTGLTSVTIPNSVTSIGNDAFQYCSSLTSVTINSNALVSRNYTYSIGSIFGYQVTEYIIGEGVMSIGSNAFSGCSSLTSVTIPNSVKSIGNKAFSGCTGLTAVHISDLAAWCKINFVYYISANPLSYAHNLYLNGELVTDLVIPNSVTSIGDGAFQYCSSLTSVTIPKSIKSIGEYAFYDCSNLNSITIEANTPPSLGDKAFDSTNDCPINVPYNTVNTYKNAWTEYSSRIKGNSESFTITFLDWDGTVLQSSQVEEGTLPKYTGTTPVRPEDEQYTYTFSGWSPAIVAATADATYTARYEATKKGNTSFTITFLDWDGTVLQSSQVEEDTLPKYTGATPVRPDDEQYTYTFNGWSPAIVAATADATYTARYEATKKETNTCGDNLTWDLTDGVLTISGTGKMTDFSYPDYGPWYSSRSSIKTLNISDGVTSIGNYAFYNCSALTSVTIPNSVTSIGNGVFSGCESLTSVTIGNSVTSIGFGAFESCTGLTSVTIPNSVTSIGNNAFSECTSLTSVTIGNSVTSIDPFIFQYCSNLKTIDIDADNPNYSSVDGVLYNKDKTTLILCPGRKQGAFDIPNSVTSIGSRAFAYCSSLTSVTIPNSVTSIGEGAFAYCSSLTSATIPNSVTSIGDYAFYLCSSLTSIEIPNSVTSIGEGAFAYCSSLTSIEIPNSVTSIGEGAFAYCSSLTSVIVGNGVKEIVSPTFSGCPLKNITLGTGLRKMSVGAFPYNVMIDGYDEDGLPMPKTDASGNFIYTVEKVVCYAKVPPTIELSGASDYKGFLDNFAEAVIYVPQESVSRYQAHTETWGRLDIRPIKAESVATDNLVITPSETSADIVWPAVSGAATYELVIKDKQGNIICTLIFNANGQLASIAFHAPARGDAPQQTQAAGFSFTVTGLDSGSSYDLTMASKDEKGNTIDEKHLSFSTTGDSPTAIDAVETSKLGGSTKILRDGQVYIERNGKIYTVTGAEVR